MVQLAISQSEPHFTFRPSGINTVAGVILMNFAHLTLIPHCLKNDSSRYHISISASRMIN